MKLDYKVVGLQVFAISVIYIVLQLPIAFAATQVNIFATPSSGTPAETTEYNMDNFLNFNAIIHLARRGGPKVELRINGANELYDVKKILLYKCRNTNPVECSRFIPQPYDNYVDTELDWADISEKENPPSLFPQIAHLMILVKLEGDGNTRWLGIWHTITRGLNNEFVQSTDELNKNYINNIDVYANSPDMVDAIKTFIDTTGMLPINWISKIVFNGIDGRYAIGADESELENDQPVFQTIESAKNTLESISKDYYFVFTKDSDEVKMPFVVNDNPSFTCGNGVAELGETKDTCCLDAGCPGGSYCDWTGTSSDRGTCKSLSSISMDVVPDMPSAISDCSGQVDIDLVVTINNAPSSLTSTLSGTLTLAGSSRAVTCTGEAGIYRCPVTLSPPIECGNLDYQIGPNTLELMLTFNNGGATATQTLTKDFGNIEIPYSCTCSEGKYCDIDNYVCTNTEPISLSAVFDKTYIENWNPGEDIPLTARVNNPPTGMTVTSVSSHLALEEGKVYGNIECDTDNPTHEPTPSENYYDFPCTMHFTIDGYSTEKTYTFPQEENNLTFEITFPDGSESNRKTLEISRNFGSIILPSFTCGDGKCDTGQGEDSTNYCCQDCGCPEEYQPQCTSTNPCYCDEAYGCVNYGDSDFELSVKSMKPQELSDCEAGHVIYADIEIKNNANTEYNSFPPYNMSVDSCTHLVNGVSTGTTYVEGCEPILGPHSGRYNCTIVVQPVDNCEDAGDDFFDGTYYYVGGIDGSNTIECDISFNGIHKTISGSVDPIKVKATYHCGDGVCESSIGEDNTNCCLDCPCDDPDNEYCAWSTDAKGDIGCRQKADLALSISASEPKPGNSCEVDNKMEITATLTTTSGKPLPDDLVVTGYWAEINGKKAQNFVCKPESDSQGTSGAVATNNYVYDCTLIIPAKDDCTSKTCTTTNSVCLQYNNPACKQGDEGNKCLSWNHEQCIGKLGTDKSKECPAPDHTCTNPTGEPFAFKCPDSYCVDINPVPSTILNGWQGFDCEPCYCESVCECAVWCDPNNPPNEIDLTNNKIFFNVNIWDGQQRIPYTIEGDLNDITITQSTRTMNDIIQDNIALLEDQLYALQKQQQKMLKTAENCLKWLIGLAITNILITIGSGIAGGIWHGDDTVFKGVSNGITAGTSFGNSLVNTVSQICDMLQKINQMIVESIQLNIKMISMQNCMDVQQHMMDTGACVGQEQACISQLIGCIKFGDIESGFNTMQSITTQIGNDANNIGKSWMDTAKIWDDTFTPAKAPSKVGVSFICNGRDASSCCEYRPTPSNKQCVQSTLKVLATGDLKECTRPMARITMGDGSQFDIDAKSSTPAVEINDDFFQRKPGGDEGTGKETVTAQIFCDDNGNGKKDSDEKFIGPKTSMEWGNAYEYSEDAKSCMCYGINQPTRNNVYTTTISADKVTITEPKGKNEYWIEWDTGFEAEDNKAYIYASMSEDTYISIYEDNKKGKSHKVVIPKTTTFNTKIGNDGEFAVVVKSTSGTNSIESEKKEYQSQQHGTSPQSETTTEFTLNKDAIDLSVTENSVTFKFDTGAETYVEYAVVKNGETPESFTQYSTEKRKEYEITVSGLEADTTYVYFIRAWTKEDKSDKKDVSNTFSTKAQEFLPVTIDSGKSINFRLKTTENPTFSWSETPSCTIQSSDVITIQKDQTAVSQCDSGRGSVWLIKVEKPQGDCKDKINANSEGWACDSYNGVRIMHHGLQSS